ncbi:MAG: MATE family efflux transporter [Gemmatimonadales bacterium]|nr:MAG: MATE family efflux transporter [Gemmatimonadales bacterium]
MSVPPVRASRLPPVASLLRPTRRDLSRVVRLAVPVALVQVGMMAMGVVDTIMVGRVSPEDLAAVALGNLYFFTTAVFGMGLLMALDPLVAQAVGAGDETAAAKAVQRGLILSLVLACITSLALVPATPVFQFLQQPLGVIPIAAGYAHWSIPGTLGFFLFVIFRQTLQAMGRVAPLLWTVLAANGLNAFLNWILIWGNLGAPRLGAVGSAMGSSLARWFMAIALLGVAWPLLRPYLRPLRPGLLNPAPLLRMVVIGAPIGLQSMLEFGAFALTGIFMGWLGTAPMAAHQVALNLAAFTFMVPLGIAAAGAVRVGQEIGRGEPDAARGAAGASLLLGFAFMSVTALVLLLFPGPLGRIYTEDAAVLAMVTLLIPIAGVFQVFDGLQAVAAGILRGAGDTRVPVLINLAGFWLVGLPLSLLLGFTFGHGPVGIWWGLAAGLAVVAVLLLSRVVVRMGRDLQRLTVDR